MKEQVQEIQYRWPNGLTSPFREGQIVRCSLESIGEDRSQKEQTIGRNLQLWQARDSLAIANLPLGHTDEAFLVAVIDLDFPAVDISLDKGLDLEFWIGADEECGFTIEEFGTFAKAVAQRFDDDQQ